MPKIYEMTAPLSRRGRASGEPGGAAQRNRMGSALRGNPDRACPRLRRRFLPPRCPLRLRSQFSADAASLDTALAGAHFLSLLLERGSAYEFAGRARDTVTGLAATIEATAQPLIEAIQTAPGYPSLDSQLQAMLRVTRSCSRTAMAPSWRAPCAWRAAPPRTPPPSLRASPC